MGSYPQLIPMNTEEEFQDWLRDAIEAAAEEDEDMKGDNRVSITTYDDCGMLTRNKGLVVRIGGYSKGAEWQLTIVQSKRAPEDDEEE